MDTLAPSGRPEALAWLADTLAVMLVSACTMRRLRWMRAELGGRLDGAGVLCAIALWEMQSSDNMAQAAAARAEIRQMLGFKAAIDPDAPWSLRGLAPLAGSHRETLRRELGVLARQGWLLRDGPRYQLSPRALAWFDGPVLDSLAADVCATAALIEVLAQGGAAADARAAQLRDAALATEPERLTRLAARRLSPEARAGFLAYLLRYFAHAAQFFERDLLTPLLLGEIAQRNFAVIFPAQPDSLAALAAGLQEDFIERVREHPAARASNGYSLAECLGIPRETARRRLAEMLERSYVERDVHGLYWCTRAARQQFGGLNRERHAELLRAATQQRRLADAGAAQQRAA